MGLTRRQALSALTLSALPAAGCMQQRSYRAVPMGGEVVVPAAELAVLSSRADALRVLIDSELVIVRREGDGFRALHGQCTHKRCDLSLAPDGYDCPCHGSRFDLAGAVLSGPAREPLLELAARLADDGLHIDLEGR